MAKNYEDMTRDELIAALQKAREDLYDMDVSLKLLRRNLKKND